MKNETAALKAWKARNEKYWSLKLHGGRFQSAMPDVIAIGPKGDVWFLEFKCVSGVTLPWSKCRLDQHLMLKQLKARGTNCYYVVWSEKKQEFFYINPDEVREGETLELTPAHTKKPLP